MSEPIPVSSSPTTPTPSRRKPTGYETTTARQRRDAAAQSARREILANLHDDWTWPPPPSPTPVVGGPPPRNTTTTTTPSSRTTPSTQWCARFSDSSSSSSSSSSTPTATPVLSPSLNPYKFDTPDSLAQTAVSRKRKRQRKLRNEMAWNEGLAIYVQRRDAWTGAYTPSISHDACYNNSSTTPRIHACNNNNNSNNNLTPPPPLIPLPAPIIASSHPLRASITPATYPAIYSKVVVQGLTPTVPINLSHVVKALVHEWKERGEWPPKSDAELAVHTSAGTGTGMGMGMGKRAVVVGAGKKGDGFAKMAVGTTVRKVLRLGEGKGGGGLMDRRIERD